MLARLKITCRALWFASRDPRIPWPAKTVAALTAAYAFSPIDLIPDFIPLVGYLDDLLIIPFGIWLTIRLIPDELWQEHLARARAEAENAQPVSWAGAIVIGAIWILLGVLAIWCWRQYGGRR